MRRWKHSEIDDKLGRIDKLGQVEACATIIPLEDHQVKPSALFRSTTARKTQSFISSRIGCSALKKRKSYCGSFRPSD
jgi:hypothetical protein